MVKKLTLSIRHVTIVPFGNKAFYWLSGTKNLSAANRKAVSIHVTTPVICISERFFPHTAHSRHLKGGGGKFCIVSFQHVYKQRYISFFFKLLQESSNILVDSGFRLKSKLNNVKYSLCECFCQRYYSPPTSSMPKLDSYYSTPPGSEENYDKINFFSKLNLLLFKCNSDHF